eukprot:SAG31_NODE_5890_length_2272_cov_1.184998_3_plen_189_part_00
MDEFGDRAELFAAMETARSTGLDWATWYTQRECQMPSAASVAHCATFQNASMCNADSGCHFVDKSACKAIDTDCFPCRDAQSKQCPQAHIEYFCNHGVNVAQSLKFWAIEGRVAGALNSSESPAVLANKTVERMHRCHGQPGGVFSGVYRYSTSMSSSGIDNFPSAKQCCLCSTRARDAWRNRAKPRH